MKKRFIPATVAALALTFSAVAVPQAVAQQAAYTVADLQADTVDFSVEAGTAINPFTIAAEADEDAVVSVTGLPDGLTFNDENRTVSGTPTTPSPQGGSSTVTVTVTEDGETETYTFGITVTADVTDPEIATIADQNGYVNTPVVIDINVSEPATVTVDGLPEGLAYNPEAGSEGANGAIVGTPTTATETGAPARVTVKAVDTAGNAAEEVTFTFTIALDTTAPTIKNPGLQEYELGTEIDPLEIEFEVDEPATVTVEGLPEGLEFDEESRAITGTPTEVVPEENPAEVKVNATDEAGNEAEEITFNITVGPDITAPVITNPGRQTFEVGQEIDPFEIEVSEAADVTVDGLPTGLTFNEENLTISGTPTVSGNPVTVTIRAEDEAGNIAEPQTFTILVNETGEDPGDDDGSSLSSDLSSDNLGLILGGGVLAAIIGVIAAIGGGFIPLPPAIANMIPFL